MRSTISRFPSRVRLMTGVWWSALLACLPGCQQPAALPEERAGARPEAPEFSAIQEQKLRVDLLLFADNFAASVAGTADAIASQTKDRRVRELTLLWKLRLIPTIQRVVRTPDPREGFLDAWAICTQMRHVLEVHSESFGDEQRLAQEVARELENRIEEIGTQFVPAAQLADVKKEIERFAEGYPISDRFAWSMKRASQVAKSGAEKLASILTIPVSGLADSAEAIDRLAHTAAVFTEVLQEIPERVRWHSELLLFKMEELDSVTQSLRDLTEVSRSFQTVSQAAKMLPADLRKELTELVESTEAAHARLDTTLREALEVTENLTKAGAAWDGTAKSVGAVVTAINDMSSAETRNTSGDGSSFDVNDYTRAAEAIRSGAEEVRALLDELESGRLAGTLETVGTTADVSIDRAADRSERLVDQITIRVVILIALFFGALLAYRALVSRLAR